MAVTPEQRYDSAGEMREALIRAYQSPETDENGFIQKQLISRSRPDISPFSYFESSEKAESDIDEFLLNILNY